MGVPKFYRWVSERYPCLSEVLKEYQLPEFDNLYLDMNGIIHVCSHPEDNNPHFRITEEKIFADIFHYIEVLFRMIKPRKVFFMAIDGVAPRAKMNQQRGRRFRSAREAEELIKQAVLKGETLPKEQRFDSNCITPGTEFMAKLHEQLKYFVSKKISTDRLWQGPRIYLSGHETPGEGEHKIMDFIRKEKSQNDYDPNTRHCLYGLDADLIMLGLATHEPHFSLLREEIRFTGKNSQKRSTAPEETTFHLLHLSLMREYLDFEFGNQLKSTLPFMYNLENIIDDWVFMGFLVGNDFIPHLPHLHIHSDCLPLLWQTYKAVLPTLDGYLNENGYLNLTRFEKYLTVLAQFDRDSFQEKYEDLKWAESKRKQRLEVEAAGKSKDSKSAPPIHHKTSSLSSEMVGIPTADEFMKRKDEFDLEKDTLEGLIDADFLGDSEDEDEEESGSDDESDGSDAEFNSEFRKYKANYYIEKMDYKNVTTEVLKSQAYGYVQALQWILHYYYNGVQSWSWYYPHHYAPYLSDVKDFSRLKIEFELGKPFLPYQQLMAVLPTASKNLLPEALQTLMVSDQSPVKEYYPVDFETDLNGKLQEWEAVVLIPFIDENRLLSAMEPVMEKLTPAEKARNKHGPHLLYIYVSDELEPFRSSIPDKFPDILHNHAKLTEVPQDGFVVPISQQRLGLCEEARLDVFFPGFPTLKHLPHRASLKKAGVKVFQMNSRNENMILELTDRPQLTVDKIAQELIGRVVFVGWPHLYEALVEAVASDETRFCSIEIPPKEREPSVKAEIRSEPLSLDSQTVWHQEAMIAQEWYLNRMGVETGDVDVLVYARPMSGRRYVCGRNGLVTLERQWQSRAVVFAHQIIVKDIEVKDHSFTQFKTLEQLFPVKAKVFLMGKPNYGVMGEVEDIEDGRVRASFRLLEEPRLTNVKQQKAQLRYHNAYNLAQQVGISPHHLSRITGTVFIVKGSRDGGSAPRLNVGLNLKFNKTGKEVPGYTRKNNNDWTYSEKVAQVLRDYSDKFPEVFECIKINSSNDLYYEDDVFRENKSERMAELEKYLKSIPCADVTPVPMGTTLLEEDCVHSVEEEVARSVEVNRKKKKTVKMQVRPHLLYQPLEAQANTVPDPLTTYALFDRVVNVRDGFTVPLGLRGTIIGINQAEKERDVLYDVLFDEEFLDGLTVRSSPNRVYRLPSTAMINITFGEERREDAARLHQQRQQNQQQQQQPYQRQPQQYQARASNQQQQGSAGRFPSNHVIEPRMPRVQAPRQISVVGGGGYSVNNSNDPRPSRQSPSTNGSSKQQSQPVPVFKLLTRPKPGEQSSATVDVKSAMPQPSIVSDESPAVSDVISSKSQPSNKPDEGLFAEIWSQLQLGVKSESPRPAPESAIKTSRSNTERPLAPIVNGLPLRPPLAWLQQNLPAGTSRSGADALSTSVSPSKSEKATVPSSAIKTEKLERILSGEEQQFFEEQTQDNVDGEEKKQTQDVTQVLSQLFKSVEITGQRELLPLTPSSSSFGRQLTVEELFKGVDECKQWQPVDSSAQATTCLPSSEILTADQHESSMTTDANIISVSGRVNDELMKSFGSNVGQLQAPGSMSMMPPIRPTLVELGGRSRTVDSLEDYGIGQQLDPKLNQKKQMQKEQAKSKPQQRQQTAQQRPNQQQQYQQWQQQYHPHQSQPQQFPTGGMMFRPPVPQMKVQNRSKWQELQMICQMRGLVNRFECYPVADGRFEATVFVGNMKFVGSKARSGELAIDSAATLGLFNLQQNVPMNRHFPVPAFSTSVNSAFRPPVPGAFDFTGFGYGMRGPQQGLWSQPLPARPAAYRQSSQMPTRPSTAGAARDTHSAAANSSTDSTAATTVPADHSKPQFVPTQVMRQQKTPQKNEKTTDSTSTTTTPANNDTTSTITLAKNDTTSTVTLAKNDTTSTITLAKNGGYIFPQPLDTLDVSDNLNKRTIAQNTSIVTSDILKTPVASSLPLPSGTSTPNATPTSAETKPRKGRSRIAANFGALGQTPPS